MRFIALTRPAESYAARGAEHPLGAGAFGLTSFLPTGYGREEALRLADAVPVDVLRDTVVYGTPDDVAATISEFVAAGAPPRAAHQHDPARRTGAGGRPARRSWPTPSRRSAPSPRR